MTSSPAEKENLIFTVRNTATENRYEFPSEACSEMEGQKRESR